MASTLDSAIPAESISRKKSEFECLNHDVYDVILVRGKVRGLIVQARWFWQHLRKTRSKMTKSYYVLTSVRNKVTVRELENATCAKRSKTTTELGQLAGHYRGNAPVPCATPVIAVDTAFKVLAETSNDTLVSAFDGSGYKPDIWRSEMARQNHGGGRYCHEDEELAIERRRQEKRSMSQSRMASAWSFAKSKFPGTVFNTAAAS